MIFSFAQILLAGVDKVIVTHGGASAQLSPLLGGLGSVIFLTACRKLVKEALTIGVRLQCPTCLRPLIVAFRNVDVSAH